MITAYVDHSHSPFYSEYVARVIQDRVEIDAVRTLRGRLDDDRSNHTANADNINK